MKSGYQSPVIDELIRKNKDKLINLAKEKNLDVKAPFSLLDSNESIDILVQNSVYIEVLKQHKNREPIKLPSNVDYQKCKKSSR